MVCDYFGVLCTPGNCHTYSVGVMCMGGVGTKPKPLLSIEVSSLVRVQEDKFTQWLLFCTVFGFCLC